MFADYSLFQIFQVWSKLQASEGNDKVHLWLGISCNYTFIVLLIACILSVGLSIYLFKLYRKVSAERDYFINILDAIPQPITVTDLNMHWTFVNRAVEKMIGVDRKTIYGMHCSNWKADICNTEKCGIAMLRKGINKSEFQNKESDHWYQTNVSYIYNNSGDKVGHIELVWDIHDERTKEELQIATLRSIGDGVIACSSDGRVTMVNRVAERLTGWRASEAAGKSITEVFRIVNEVTHEEMPSPALRALESKSTVDLPEGTVLISKDSTEYMIADSCAPICDIKGNVLGAVLVFRDITSELALQEQLSHTQKMEAVGQLAGGIAHDFNNMLGGIIGGAELLHDEFVDNPKCSEMLSVILTSAERAADLADKLLSFSRRQVIHSMPVNMHKIIDDTISLLTNTIDRRIKILSKEAAENSVVIGDQSQLQSILVNLGINSAHAIQGAGVISFSTKTTVIDKEYCCSSNFTLTPGEFIEIKVCDTGCGISANDITHIFEPFYTTKKQGEGTGLGLSAAYGAIQQHKGEITVSSEVGQGTSFNILLPLSELELSQSLDSSEELQGNGLVLVIDDESAIRKVAEILLHKYGYDSLMAENGKIGLDLYRKYSDKIDLVILDMIMPEMNGHDCFMEIKKICPEAKIIISTGFSRDREIEALSCYGLSGIIRKPFHGAEFGSIITAALQKE